MLDDNYFGRLFLGFCRDGTCVDGRYFVLIDRVVTLLIAGAEVQWGTRRGRRGAEWAEDTARRVWARKKLVEFCPFHVTFNECEGILVKPAEWIRGGGQGDPYALRRIVVQLVGNKMELVPVEVPIFDDGDIQP